tara:strand:+ start:558 stop:1112 length:555 start_codon:yes stop_codon:yes gene_type:complete
MATLVSTAKSASANSYATLAESNIYMQTVRSDQEKVWLKITESTRERYLIMSTRLIDQHYDFIGYKTTTDQALQWPRQNSPKDGKWAKGFGLDYLDQDTIPSFLKDATAELARILVDTDVTADPDGAGMKQIAMGGMAMTFNEKDRISQGVIRSSVYSFLRKYGSYKPSLNAGAASITMARVSR